MQTTAPQQVTVEPLKELFGDVEQVEKEALQRLGDEDFAEAPQAIGSVVLSVRARC